MAEVFGRKYSLKIGRNKELIKTLKPLPEYGPYAIDKASQENLVYNVLTNYSVHKVLNGNFELGTGYSYNDISVIPAKSITITDLHIEADIVDNNNTKTSSSQVAKIRVFNLKQDTRDFIRVGDSAILHAGWEQDGDELPLLYVGQIETVKTLPRQGNDIITELTLKPAKLLDEIKVNRSYPPGVTVGDVIDDMIKIAASKGLPLGRFIRVNDWWPAMDRIYQFGVNIYGPLLKALEELCSNANYKSMIVLGKLYIFPNGYPGWIKTATVTPINIKGTVEVQEDGSGASTSQSGSNKGKGLKFTINLNGNVDTTTVLKLRGTDYDGNYKVQSVKHIITYEGSGPYDTELSVVEINK